MVVRGYVTPLSVKFNDDSEASGFVLNSLIFGLVFMQPADGGLFVGPPLFVGNNASQTLFQCSHGSLGAGTLGIQIWSLEGGQYGALADVPGVLEVNKLSRRRTVHKLLTFRVRHG